MALVFANNAITTLASGINSAVTTITLHSGGGAQFPSPTGGDIFYGTLQNGTSIEIVAVTARSGDVLTVIRGQDGTSANGFPAGASFDQRVTRADLQSFLQTAVSNVINSILPDQTGNNGKFLETDGTNVLWAAAGSGLPSGGSVGNVVVNTAPGAGAWSSTIGHNTIIGTAPSGPVTDAALTLKAFGTNTANLYIEGTGGIIVPTIALAMPSDPDPVTMAGSAIDAIGPSGAPATGFSFASDGAGSNLFISPHFPDAVLATHISSSAVFHILTGTGSAYVETLNTTNGTLNFPVGATIPGSQTLVFGNNATESMHSDTFGGFIFNSGAGFTFFGPVHTSASPFLAGANLNFPIEIVPGQTTRPQLALTAAANILNGLDILPNVVDGASSIAVVINNQSALTTVGAKLLSVQNNASEVAFIDYTGLGNFSTGGLFVGASALTFGSSVNLTNSGSTLVTTGNFTSGGFIQLGGAGVYYGENTITTAISGLNVASTGTAVAVSIDNTIALTTAGDKLLSIRNDAVEQFYVDYQGNIVVGTQFTYPLSLMGSNSMKCPTILSGSGSALALLGNQADGGTAIAVEIGSNQTFSTGGSKILTVRNNGSEVFYIDYAGNVTASGTISGGGGGTLVGFGAFGSSPNADGGSVSGSNIILQPADGTHPGGISTTTQTLGSGVKTFSSNPVFSAMTVAGIVHNSVTTGALTSSLVVDADVDAAAAIAVSKLAAGTNTFILTTTGGVPVWAAPVSGYITSITTPTTAQADGMSVTAGALALSLADSSHPGIIAGTSVAQTLAPTFTFSAYGTGLLHSGSGGAITSSLIVAADITNATITGTQIAATTIAAGNIVNNTITATQIASGTITSTQIASPTTTFINALLPSQGSHASQFLQTDGAGTLSWATAGGGGGFSGAGTAITSMTIAAATEFITTTSIPGTSTVLNNLIVSSNAIYTSGYVSWGTASAVVGAPTATQDNTYADLYGSTSATLTTASELVFPAVTGAGALSVVYSWNNYSGMQLGASTQYTASVYMRCATGTQQVYIFAVQGLPPSSTNWYGAHLCTVTTTWTRFTTTFTSGTSGTYFFCIGADLNDVSQSPISAATVWASGAQCEPGAVATNLIVNPYYLNYSFPTRGLIAADTGTTLLVPSSAAATQVYNQTNNIMDSWSNAGVQLGYIDSSGMWGGAGMVGTGPWGNLNFVSKFYDSTLSTQASFNFFAPNQNSGSGIHTAWWSQSGMILWLDAQNALNFTSGGGAQTLNNLLPSQGAHTNQFLQTTGSSVQWAALTGVPTFGTATIDFGSAPGSNLTTVTVTTSGLAFNSNIWCWMQADSTATHNATEHIMANIKLVGQYVGSTSFTIYAVAISDRYDGQFTVHWGWA